MKHASLGLPGKITDTALVLPPGLLYEEIRDGLHLVGRIGRSLGWWAVDLLLYAEYFGEARFSQLAEELGYAPHTLQNLLTVGHAWAPKRRRAGLEIGHHSALAHLDHEDQEHYATLAEKGDILPNHESKRWSVTRLREELRALNPAKPAPPMGGVKTAGKGTIAGSVPAAGGKPPLPVLALGMMVEFDDIPGRWRIKQAYRVPGEVIVKLVEV